MRIIGIFFLCNLTLQAIGRQQATFSGKSDSIRISGTITGFKPGQEDGFISFSTYDVSGNNKKKAVQINADGTFDVTLFQPFEGDIDFSFKDAYLSLYAVPGRQLTLNVMADRVNRETGHKGAFAVNGAGASVSNLMFLFAARVRMHTFRYTADLGNKTQPDSAYADARRLQMTETLALLDDFITRNAIKDIVFENWQRNHILYDAAKDILLFPFLGKFNTGLSVPELARLLGAIRVTNQAALHNSAYYKFLRMLAGDISIIVNINRAYGVKVNTNGNNMIPVYLDEIDKLSNGIARELMYVAIYDPTPRNSNSLAMVYDRVAATVKQPDLRILLDEKREKANIGFLPYNIMQKLAGLKLSGSLTERIGAWFTQREGSALYIDFWGDWCAPCMSEMPNYSKLIGAFEGKPIRFLFFSVFTTPEAMAAVKKKFGINADFINLTNDEAMAMTNLFEFDSYPSHYLADKSGKVVAPRLTKINSDMGLEQVTATINQRLAW